MSFINKDINNCPICLSPLLNPTPLNSKDIYNIDCLRCGYFNIIEAASDILHHNQLNSLQIANASGWIRYNQGIEISTSNLETLRTIPSPSVAEKANKLLLYLSKSYPLPGQPIPHDFSKANANENEKVFLLSIAWAIDFQEFSYLFDVYLVQTKGFLIQATPIKFLISPEGWAYIDSLNKINPESQIGFVAMRFHKETEALWTEAIKPGIENAGYEPKRMDRHEHNNRIDDEMIAMIRRSKFLVADFTEQRQNVYFEAGLALGLGLHVIWVCRKDEVEENKVHFDTRQYPFIRWEEGKLDDLKKALQYRIERTFGHGKYPSSI